MQIEGRLVVEDDLFQCHFASFHEPLLRALFAVQQERATDVETQT